MSAVAHPDLRERFTAAMHAVGECSRPGEVTTGWLRAEVSDFVRFNHGQVRQAGTVDKAAIELRLIRDAPPARPPRRRRPSRSGARCADTESPRR